MQTATLDRPSSFSPAFYDSVPDAPSPHFWLNPPANDNQIGTLPRVVGLCGLAGSGKSTVADYMVRKHGYTRVRFAGPLKAMARAVGLSDEHIEGSLKEVPLAMLCGRTPRFFMQRLGKEFGRDLVGEDFWVNLWTAEAGRILSAGGRIVADDARFENEVERIRDESGIVGVVDGRGGIAGNHSSEGYRPEADFVLHNGGSLRELYQRIDEVLFAA